VTGPMSWVFGITNETIQHWSQIGMIVGGVLVVAGIIVQVLKKKNQKP